MAVKRASTGRSPRPRTKSAPPPAQAPAKRAAKRATRQPAAKRAPRKAPPLARAPAPAPARRAPRKPVAAAVSALQQMVLAVLADMKAVNVKALDVRGLTDVTDTMVVASGTSDRHVRSIAERVVQRCKEAGYRPYGIEGQRDGEWVLLDLHDLVLHVMLPRTREFYALEKLWEGASVAA